MKNKKFIYLIFFLLFPLTTHCTKRNHAELTTSHKNTIQELQIKYDKFKQKLDNNTNYWKFGLIDCPYNYLLTCTYHQNLHKKTYGQCSAKEFDKKADEFPDCASDRKFFNWFNIDNLKNFRALNRYKNIHINNYSALGSATMAENVSFQGKQVFIQKLLHLDFEPTSEDKELALVERWKRWQPIIKKICLLRNSHFFIEIEMPCELNKFIEQLILETEKSLL